MNKTKRYAVIVAGGSGTRFGSQVPKQFLVLDRMPILMRTITLFAHCHEIVLVLPQNQQDYWKELCAEHQFAVPHRIVSGGSTRFESVRNALGTIAPQPGDLIAVHDGVRPLASRQMVDHCFEQALAHGSAIPVVEVSDSIRRINDDHTSVPLLRSSLRAVQTPQVFEAQMLASCYDVPFSPLFTDDASVVESAGHQVHLCHGETTNIKITHPRDLDIALAILRNS